MENVYFGIRIMGGQYSWLGSLSKTKFKKLCDEKQASVLQINKNDVYPMQPWFYSLFKGEKDELLK